MGDYLYSIAFQLISGCVNADILGCISAAAKGMCEGELLQVLERDNPDMLKQRYLVIVKKKTASLFAASCQAGAMIAGCSRTVHVMLKEYGLNFGIAFQIADDCLDLTGEVKAAGKSIGSDFRMGELTLPLLNLISGSKDKKETLGLLRRQDKEQAFKEIKMRFLDSGAYQKTQDDIKRYIVIAKKSLHGLNRSSFKDNLYALADYLASQYIIPIR
jgi:octaprenyl-diphosphate synthase